MHFERALTVVREPMNPLIGIWVKASKSVRSLETKIDSARSLKYMLYSTLCTPTLITYSHILAWMLAITSIETRLPHRKKKAEESHEAHLPWQFLRIFLLNRNGTSLKGGQLVKELSSMLGILCTTNVSADSNILPVKYSENF